MANLKIGTKLMVAFGVLMSALLIMALLSLGSQHSLNDAANLLGKDRRNKLVAIAEINTATSDYRIGEATSILAEDPANIKEAELAIASRQELIAKDIEFLDRTLQNAAARSAFSNFREQWASFLQRSKTTLQLSHANLNIPATASFRASYAQFNKANTAAADLQTAEVKVTDADVAAADATYDFGRSLSIAIFLGVLALAGVLLVSLIRSIARPLTSMTEVIGKLATGDLTARIDMGDRKDEIGKLARSMEALRGQLTAAERAKQEQTSLIVSSIGSGLDALAQGDLTARIDAELTGPFAKLKIDFNKAMEAVASVMTAVQASANGITSGASDIRQASDDLSKRTEQQAASLEETAAAMEQITGTVRRTAENAKKANGVVATTRSTADQSGVVVQQAVEAMGHIERSSTEISNIIAVIDGIAFQTNLLALNAGVEAARAGDAGRGFAVVASEVRALAQRSADAAKDVKEKITASTQQVDAGVGLVAKAGEALTMITQQIGEISVLVNEIATAAEQQAVGLHEVNTAVGDMDGVTQQNAAMVEEATAAARSLAEETDVMLSEVGRFKLSTSDMPRATTSSNVHQLQARATQAAVRLAHTARGRGSNAAALAADDWSQF